MNHPNTCKRGCCWTPLGVCARKYGCNHHVEQSVATEARAARESADQELVNFLAGKGQL